jgi:hypothetical protein
MVKLARISIAIALLAGFAFGQCKTETCGLVVRGRVVDLTIDKSDKDYVRFDVNLAMEFKNEGERPLILFKPNVDNSYFEGRYWLGAFSLSESENGEPIHSAGGWESVMGSDFYRRLATELDTNVPAPEFTRTLQPNEVWEFPDRKRISFSIHEDKLNSGPRKGWKEMQAISSNLWLEVFYELSPWNVEYFKPDLIRKLAKRWKNYGDVLVEPKKEGRYNHFDIGSQPMKIDLSLAKPKTR